MNMSASNLLHQCRAAGLTVRLDGSEIAIKPARRCPPELLAAVRAAKPALMELLEIEAANLPADCKPWLHVARQILAGEFNGADGSTVASLVIGLRSVNHPQCRRALNRLQPFSRR